MLLKALITSLLVFFTISPVHAGPFDNKENTIARSPSKESTLILKPGDSVVDFGVSPLKAEAALIVKTASGHQKILLWKIGESTAEMSIPENIQLSSLTWHPKGRSLFMLATQGNEHQVLKNTGKLWEPVVIFRAKMPLQKLIIGPRPFETGYNEKTQENPTYYRLFFGVKETKGNYETHSMTENGQREYAVFSTVKNRFQSANKNGESDPNFARDNGSILLASSAQPVFFHPAGHLMIWENHQHCFQKVGYGSDDWVSSEPVFKDRVICGGKVAYTPNGAALLHWKPENSGVTMLFNGGKDATSLAPEFQFLSLPIPVPDGKGLVGLVRNGSHTEVKYVPVDMLLADVVNAWMFLESPEDLALLTRNKGILRTLDYNQLYELYDSESYHCGDYDRTTPTRPYLVTTDIFLELYASAFEGIFVLSERQTAMPAFWQFVEGVHHALKNEPNTRLAKAFTALTAVHDNVGGNEEAARIIKSEGILTSTVTDADFDFGNLKPRGHYTVSSELQTYFRASKYLMDLQLEPEDLTPLKRLPKPVMQAALTWINAYKPFIAPAKRPSIWQSSTPIPGYVSHPDPKSQLFPMSWGIDNEILFSTVYHRDFPPSEQIVGRLLPSGLDVAAVLGSEMAETILDISGEFKKYPNLKTQIARLKTQYKNMKPSDSETLYHQWLSTLATQWTADLNSPGDTIDKPFWASKRLQTGLASWATLRHITVLVNERSVSECGEAGFENIVLRPPRGYVEPDVKTLNEIANLFEATIYMLETQSQSGVSSNSNNSEVLQGVIRRLAQSRDKVRLFRDIASKEIQGIPLSNEEYEEILYVGRAAEHNFLIFKSLSQKDFGLVTPDPIGKVADVAASPDHQFLLVGVGKPMEWDQIVPFFGRKQIVKGAVYSYHQLIADQVLTDSEWRSKVAHLAPPHWIAPLISNDKLSCPAKDP